MLSRWFGGPLPVGSAAPDFTLPDEHGDLVRLSALRGHNIVLVFYPGDDTPICRKQLCAFRDRWDLAQKSHTLIFGVNPRGAPSHARFREKLAFPFPLLVDRGQKVAALYRASGLFVRRTVYLAGPDGTILYARRGNPAPEEVLAAAG